MWLRAGTVSCRELAGIFLERIGRFDARLNAFVHVAGEQARADADTLDRELAAGRDRGPLHGIPIAIKDVIDVAGMPTSYGTGGHDPAPVGRDAALVAALRQGRRGGAGQDQHPRVRLRRVPSRFRIRTQSLGSLPHCRRHQRGLCRRRGRRAVRSRARHRRRRVGAHPVGVLRGGGHEGELRRGRPERRVSLLLDPRPRRGNGPQGGVRRGHDRRDGGRRGPSPFPRPTGGKALRSGSRARPAPLPLPRGGVRVRCRPRCARDRRRPHLVDGAAGGARCERRDDGHPAARDTGHPRGAPPPAPCGLRARHRRGDRARRRGARDRLRQSPPLSRNACGAPPPRDGRSATGRVAQPERAVGRRRWTCRRPTTRRCCWKASARPRSACPACPRSQSPAGSPKTDCPPACSSPAAGARIGICCAWPRASRRASSDAYPNPRRCSARACSHQSPTISSLFKQINGIRSIRQISGVCHIVLPWI